MKKHKILSIVVALALLVTMATVPALAATEEDIEQSIQKGLDWLVPQQNADGSWGTGDEVARTGLAVVKLEDRGYELATDNTDIDGPFDTDYEYSQNVTNGLNYIFGQASEPAVGIICFAQGSFYETYSTGIAMMAIAASREPDRVVPVLGSAVDGWTYQQVVQANVAYFAAAQNPPDGGWGYQAVSQPSDNSNTGYAALGLRYAEDFGCVIPPAVKEGLSNWIDYIQCKVAGSNYGGSGYMGPSDWVNLLKTGNLLFEMAFVGDNTTTPRTIAIDYIVRHWNDANTDPGWKGPAGGNPHCQAAYCLMKGLESMVIIEPEDLGGIDWFEEMSSALVGSQNANGSWPAETWGDSMLATEWALIALERVVPNRPPDCSGAYAEPGCLWPPNHNFVDIIIMGVTDADDDPITITVTGITSDEPTASDKGSGGEKHAPDANGVGTDAASVRAERSGNGDGRVYEISFTASDGRGGECESSVMVKVPHDQSAEACPAIDSGQIYVATDMN